MAGAISKENDPKEEKEKSVVPRKIAGSNLMDVLISFAKKACTVGAVYFFGYMHWSVAWLICPLILSVMRENWRKEHNLKRNIAKAAAMASEKDVILARIDDLPAWVFFPDVERAEWVNKILKQVWPNVNHYARNLIKEVIEPSVRKRLVSYKLSGFKFERMILGTIPPRIGGVKVYEKNVSRNEIIMDLDIFYAGDCDISLILSGFKGGIKDFQIHGTIRVIMKPLISTIPLVGGLQIFFLNNPAIDFDLVGIADILDMPGLSDILRKVIIEQVSAMMVLPNKLSIKLSDVIEAYSLKMPEPEGVLRVHVVEAKHLMKMDIGMLGKGKSDPYAIISIGAQEFRTQTIDNTVNPKWDYWCESPITDASAQSMYIHVWDKDDGPLDDEKLGRATIEVNNVAKKGQVDTWITLEQVKHGMVHLRLTWYKLSTNYADLKLALAETQTLRITSMSTAILTVFFDSAKNLPQARTQSKPDSYLVATVGKTSHQTDVQMRNDSPVWEQGFTFLVCNPETDSLFIKILDQKTGYNMGQFNYGLSNLASKTNLELYKEPFALYQSGPESKLVLSMSLRILKYEPPEEIDGENIDLITEKPELQRTDSSVSTGSVVTIPPPSPAHRLDSIRKQDSIRTSDRSIPGLDITTEEGEKDEITSANANSIEELIESQIITGSHTTPSESPSRESTLHHRTSSVTSSAGETGLGRIQMTLRYSVQRQKLIIVIHRIANLPLHDPKNIPDPYVKLYLLPSRSKESKRKTPVIKDNCNPVYDETFEYTMSQGELNTHHLEVTVVTQKSIFSSGSNVMGQVIIDLGRSDLVQPQTSWFDLQPETARE